MSDQLQFDIGGEFEDKNYKSCFARSVAVNSQYNQSKSLDFRPVEVQKKASVAIRPRTPENQQDGLLRMRKNSSRICHEDSSRSFSPSNLNCSSRRSSLCSTSRIAEIPVENIVNQSKIETLQWQLKEIQKSREMYRAVMKQVVTFLEKAHHSLELLGCRMNNGSSNSSRRNSVHRSKSEHHLTLDNTRKLNDTSLLLDETNSGYDQHRLKNLTWQQSKEVDRPSPEEIPPDKLAQEAFRLLRTAQSLLSTREPDLVQNNNNNNHHSPQNDVEFLQQIAKEFPQTTTTPEILQHKHQQQQQPQRATSFSLSPKLVLPDTELKISTAFSRKLSLQLGEVKRYSKCCSSISSNSTTGRTTAAVDCDENEAAANILMLASKSKSEKSTSPANGSISSVEDESGFSSMNSFQEIGLPLVNSTMTDEVSTKNVLLRSMLQNGSNNNADYPANQSFLNLSSTSGSHNGGTILDATILPNETNNNSSNGCQSVTTTKSNNTELHHPHHHQNLLEDIKLWHKPSQLLPTTSSSSSSTTSATNNHHKRWFSTPVATDQDVHDHQSLKVLWV